MKKLIASILTLALLVGILPAALGAGSTAAAATPKSIKLLAIGEEFTRDAFEYMYEVFAAEGYTDITVGYLFGAGLTLDDYIQKADANRNYCRNTRGHWEFTSSEYTLLDALQNRDWDYIVLQTTPIQSGQASAFTDSLGKMVDFINTNKTNPNAKIGWHMNWPYQNETDHEHFKTVYNSDPKAMYEAIIKATQEHVLPNSKIDFVVPMGTAFMNVTTSYIKDVYQDENDLLGDAAYLDELGKLIASYTWYSAVTGKVLQENLKFTDAFLITLSSADRKAIAESINNAIKNPCKVTESSYKTEPAQYNVVVNGELGQYMEGDTVTITAKATTNGQRTFKRWSVVKGNVSLANATALTTTFKVPAQDVEVKATYEAGDTTEGEFKVGFGRADVTPEQPAPLAGYGSTTSRMSTGTLAEEDRLTVTAIAVSDGNQTNIIMTTDFIRVPTVWGQLAKEAISEKTGVPVDQISLSATHTHSAPDIGDEEFREKNKKALTSDSWYYPVWLNGVVNAASDSLADLAAVSETKISINKVPGMNWRRHWRYSDGTMEGTNFSAKTVTYGDGVRGFAEDTDQDMQIIRFVRPGAPKDIVLVNWQGHPIMASTNGLSFGSAHHYELSAEYPGYLRRHVEAQDSDCQVAFFLGASGNVAVRSQMKSLRDKWKTPNSPIDYGVKMGDYVLKAMEHMTTVEIGAVTSLRQQQVVVGRDYETTVEIEQDTIAIGGSIAFVTAGYEMFDINAMDVKESSPYDITFVLTCTQWHEYMPSWETCWYPILGGEVAYEANSSMFNEVPGTAEDLANGLIAMLNKLYNS